MFVQVKHINLCKFNTAIIGKLSFCRILAKSSVVNTIIKYN